MDPAKSALKQPEDMIFGHIHHGTLLYTKEELADRYARGFHFNMKLRRENEALREELHAMTTFHDEERERREKRERAKHPPVYPRRQTNEELTNLTEHGRSKDPKHVPAYAAQPVTEHTYRQELADEFGDPEEHESFVVPHAPKILADDGMLADKVTIELSQDSVEKLVEAGLEKLAGPHGDGFGHGPSCACMGVPPDETYSFEKMAAELDRLDAAEEREAVRARHASINVDRVLEAGRMLEEADVPEENRTVLLPSNDNETFDECMDRLLPDALNPGHYRHADIECIDAIKAALTDEEFRGFCKGNNIKYIWRSDHKGSAEQDLAKAVWYTRMALGDDPRE